MTTRAWYAIGVGLVLVMSLRPGHAQVGGLDPDRLLAQRFGFNAEEIARARGGQPVAKLLPSRSAADVGVFGALRIGTSAERLVVWLNDVAGFRRAAQLGASHRLSDPPVAGDLAGLSLDAASLAALRDCRPGKCDQQIGERAIRRFQSEVNWASPDAAARASLITREMFLEQAKAYLTGGDQALGTYANEKAPRVVADEVAQLFQQSSTLFNIAPEFAEYLRAFPAKRLEGTEQFLYWAKGGVGSEASVSLHQLVIYRPPGRDVVVADKQLFASRYVDAAITVISLSPSTDGKSFYALVGARARSRMLEGVGARMLRRTVERATIDTTQMYLEWIRDSMAM